jgi:hypothetical protein
VLRSPNFGRSPNFSLAVQTGAQTLVWRLESKLEFGSRRLSPNLSLAAGVQDFSNRAQGAQEIRFWGKIGFLKPLDFLIP